MIQDLDKTLENVLTDAGLTVSFARPDQTFNPVALGDVVNLFLFDVRENFPLRINEPVIERANGVATVKQPPRRFDCSYLLTAWPDNADPAREHALLGSALQAFGGMPTIPSNRLFGSLIGQEPPIPLTAPNAELLPSVGEFWSAMNARIRASFTVTATISVPAYPDRSDWLATSVLGDARPGDDGPPDALLTIGGSVFTRDAAGAPVPLPNALVDVLSPRRSTRTDAAGRFTFSRLPAGLRDFRVVAVGFAPLTATVPTPGPAPGVELELTPRP